MISISDYSGGHSIQLVFENGLNLSIIQHDHSYSTYKETVEIAILDKYGNFITKEFVEGIEDDVVGHVKADELADLISKVRNYV